MPISLNLDPLQKLDLESTQIFTFVKQKRKITLPGKYSYLPTSWQSRGLCRCSYKSSRGQAIDFTKYPYFCTLSAETLQKFFNLVSSEPHPASVNCHILHQASNHVLKNSVSATQINRTKRYKEIYLRS